jgi:hypothetical protein
MSNAELIVYFGLASTIVLGSLGEVKIWLNRQDAKKLARLPADKR